MSEQEEVSLRGRTARHIVKVANHLPVLGSLRKNGALQNLQNQYEIEWKCPEHMNHTVLEMENFTMELLTREDNYEEYGERRAILQLHGGGYYGKMHNTYRYAAMTYSEVSGGYDILTPDYRVAPENPFPAALEDAEEAYKWLLEHDYRPEHIVVAGDSAGGGLTLALCLKLRDTGMPLPSGIITMSAWTDLTKSGDSYQENYDSDPIFGGTRNTLVYKEGYYAGNDPMNPYISPINGDYHGFPPMLMQVGELEMLLDDTLSVAQKARYDGVRIREHTYPGMFHIFQMGFFLYPESKEAWNEIRAFLKIIR